METLSEIQKKVLSQLVEVYNDHGGEQWCVCFQHMADDLKLEKRKVRLACRALARKGLAEYVRGLFDEDGMTAGSGYCATLEGTKLIQPQPELFKQ